MKLIIIEGALMKFYDEMKPLYLETEASRVELRDGLLQTKEGTHYPRDETPDNNIPKLITFTSKSLSAAERRYSSTE